MDTLTLSHILVGIAVGSVYAMAAIGLVLTYKATGVFNFAHAPVAIFVAFVFWQTRTDWGWPVWVAGVVSLGLVAPLLGVLFERLVFRPLERQGASTAAKLAATMGLFVFGLGAVFQIWPGPARSAPSLFPLTPVRITDTLVLGTDQLVIIVLGLAISVGLYLMLHRTRLGIAIRAVVDRRELAELMTVDANRVSSFAWALGTTLAGLAGVLLAPRLLLDVPTLLFVTLASYACAVGGRLSSLPWTYGVAVLLAVADELTKRFASGNEFFREARPQYFFVAFLILAIVLLTNVVESGVGVVRTRYRARRRSTRGNAGAAVLGAAALILLPFVVNLEQLGYAQRAIFFAVIFLSLVVLTGFTGQLNLGVAGFVGLGAFGAARLSIDVGIPELLAIPLAALVFAVPPGILIGYFAVRRRGLILGLVTLAFGVMMFSLAFQNLTLTGGLDGSRLARPSGFEGDRAFYLLELGFLGVLMLFARNVRSGRLGRILTAMRDSEAGASSVGLSLARYKLFIFAVSAFIAGVGGGLLGARSGNFSFQAFQPFDSLQWFTVVVVAGIGSINGALVAGLLFALLPAFINEWSTLLIGIGALTLGRTGNGLVGLIGAAYDRISRPLPLASARLGDQLDGVDAKVRRRSRPAPSALARERMAAVAAARGSDS